MIYPASLLQAKRIGKPTQFPIMPVGGAAEVNWWEAGGASGAIAVYQPKGAASLADSYVNLANPGTNNAAPGIAPTWNVTDGWISTGTNEYLTTGIVPGSGYTYLVQFSDVPASGAGLNRALFAVFQSTSILVQITPNLNTAPKTVGFRNGGAANSAPELLAGNLAMAGNTAYRNGVSDGAITVSTFPTTQIYILARNRQDLGGTADIFQPCRIQAWAAYNNTLTADQLAAVSAAMAAL